MSEALTPSTPASPAGSPAAQPAPGGSVEAPKRPDGLPEKFWNPEKGVLTDELVKDVATRHAAEAARAKETPAGAEHYKAELPPDFVIPAGIAFKVDENDPQLAFGRELAASQ
jgi:hypothetical protein